MATFRIAALGSVDEGISIKFKAMFDAPRLPPVDTVVENLLEYIQSIRITVPGNETRSKTGTRFILIMDDFHNVSLAEIHGAVELIIRYQPANMYLVISTREDPPFSIPSLRAKNEILELRHADLCLNYDESKKFFMETENISIGDEEIQRLLQKSEGWITGLHFAALALREGANEKVNPSRIKCIIDQFSGKHHFVLDFLFEEILKKQSDQVRAFLILSSALEKINKDLCDYVLSPMILNKTLLSPSEIMSVETILDYLLKSNLFIIPLDSEKAWFRYHNLFHDLLKAKLRQQFPDIIREIHIQVACWFWEHELYEEAIEHSFLSEDYKKTAERLEILARNTHKWTSISMSAFVLWLERLPARYFEEREWLCLYASRIYFISGQSQKGMDILDQLIQKFHRETLPDPQIEVLVKTDLASYAALNGLIKKPCLY